MCKIFFWSDWNAFGLNYTNVSFTCSGCSFWTEQDLKFIVEVNSQNHMFEVVLGRKKKSAQRLDSGSEVIATSSWPQLIDWLIFRLASKWRWVKGKCRKQVRMIKMRYPAKLLMMSIWMKKRGKQYKHIKIKRYMLALNQILYLLNVLSANTHTNTSARSRSSPALVSNMWSRHLQFGVGFHLCGRCQVFSSGTNTIKQ